MLRIKGTIWYYQTKIGKQTTSWSTGETDKRRAQAKVPELQKRAGLLRRSPADSRRLTQAMVAEVERVDRDTGEGQAARVAVEYANFAAWLDKPNLTVDQVTPKMIADYQAYLAAPHVAPSEAKSHRAHKPKPSARDTINKATTYLLRLLRQSGITIAKPKLPRTAATTYHRPFEPGELARFFSACPPAHRPLFLLLLVTGARVAEFIPSERSAHTALLKSEIDLDARVLNLRTAKARPGERAKVRRVPIPEEILPEIQAQLKATPADYKHLFAAIAHVGHLVDKILKAAGIDKTDALGQKITAHSFRHTYATLMASAVGQNTFALKEIMGHASIRTTAIYVRPTVQQIPLSLAQLMGQKETETGRGAKEGCQITELPPPEERQAQ